MVATVERTMNMNTSKEWTAQELRVLLSSYNYPASLLQQKFFRNRSLSSVSYKLNRVKSYVKARACYFTPVVDNELVKASYTGNLGTFSRMYNIPKEYITYRLIELGIRR